MTKTTPCADVPRGNDKPGGGSQKAADQQGRKIPGDGNNVDIQETGGIADKAK